MSWPADLWAERLPIHTYDTSDGLAHDRIRCIVPDSRGFLWFCTVDGLSRFDGSRFVNYGLEQGLPHPSVEEIVEVGEGVYWVATAAGLARLRSDSGRAREADAVARSSANARGHNSAALALTAYSLGADAPSNDVLALSKDRGGRLWIGTGGGLFLLEHPLDEPRFRRVEPPPSTGPARFGEVRALAEGRDGALWIATASVLYRRFHDGRVVRDPSWLHAEQIRSLLADRSGRLWIGHDDRLTVVVPASSAVPGASRSIREAASACQSRSENVRLPAAPGEACRFETLAGLPALVRSLSEGADGRIWIGTPRGLVQFDGNRLRAYSTRQGLPNATINAVSEDHAGSVWIGADAGGAARLARYGFVTFGEEDGLKHNYVTTISQSRAGRVRARGGWPVLNDYDGGRFTSQLFRIPGASTSSRLYDIFEDHTGDLWVGTSTGLFRFPEVIDVAQLARTPPRAVYTVAHGLPSSEAAAVFEDSRGDIWMKAGLDVVTRVVRWQRSTNRFHEYPETDSQAVPVHGVAFAEDAAGTVWLGTSLGLARHRNGHFTSVPLAEGNPTLAVTGLHVDPRGRLWVGTLGGGLYHADDPTAERPRFGVYTVAQGLSSGTVWCVTDDGTGDVYAGTARGVDRLKPETGEFKHFGLADGLAGSEVMAAFRDRDGVLWFGTFKGISRLAPPPNIASGPPTVWIGGLRTHGVVHRLDPLGERNVSLRDLGPAENQVQIDYFGLSPASGELLRYQYRLEGTDSAWTTPTPERSINYAELAPGSYRFIVRAINADGHASRVPASVAFTILRPVWQRWWFLATSAWLVIASGYAFHRHRVSRLLEIERLRTRIASDLHDDVGSSLTQISILSEIVRTHLGRPAAHIANPLARIGTLSRESVDSMGDIVWALDPTRDTPGHLLQRLRRVAHERLSTSGVHLRFESAGDASPHLNADVRRQVFLIFKEILNNIVRHANATAVHVDLTVAPRELHLRVTDDGCGFDPAGTAEGHGLRSMQRRASSLRGAIEVTSRHGTGTCVTLTVPVR